MNTPTRAETSAETPAEAEIGFEVINRVAVLTLNRPRALNALSHGMIGALAEAFERARNDASIAAVVLRGAGEKAFCAGGDIRALYESASADTAKKTPWLAFFVDEYRLDYAIYRFPKPVVALMDGIVMGGGMGLAQGAALRIATDRTRMAMPETRIGMVPDVGATHFMGRMPVDMALYAGLTGAMLSGADAVAFGLADACVPSTWLAGWTERLESVSVPTDPAALAETLRGVFVPAENVDADAPLAAHRAAITRHFVPGGVERMVESLSAAVAQDADEGRAPDAWLESTLASLKSHSPTMLNVSCHALLRGRQMALADCFRMELGIVYRTITEGDFREGVRALIVDKDQRPRWTPATLCEVRAERVQHFLTSPWRRDDHPLHDLGAHQAQM